ncbi:hypothetical protein B484DRAFT_444357 [Ochromonadaceae sp. CCMP2298]|nr:hypothetical protein B484DRAFT_444357 [Ochromonadaceae sp. CCMP2298]
MSDIVVCRLWVQVEPKQFYNPVLSLLAPDSSNPDSSNPDSSNPDSGRVRELGEDEELEEEEGEGGGGAMSGVSTGPLLMRTTAQVRRDGQIPLKTDRDSVYKPIVRKKREFRKLTVPAKLQSVLPFASKPKQQAQVNRGTYLQRRAVVLEPEEKGARAQLQMLAALRKDKMEKRHNANDVRVGKKRKAAEAITAKFADVHRDEKKAKYREEGKQKAHRASVAGRSVSKKSKK